MKIGILTFQYSLNYGAVIQCYALKTFLEIQGHCVEIINRQPNRAPRYKIWGGILKRILKMQNPVKFPGWSAFNKFSKNLLRLSSKPITSNNEMENYDFSDYQAIIVGSDQIWRDNLRTVGNNYFLDFLKESNDIRKISYAASFGKDCWCDSPARIQFVSELLRKFDKISVREKSGVNVCKTVFHIDAVQVLDPSLLLPKQVYERIALDHNKQLQAYDVVSYFLGEDKATNISNVECFARNKGLSYIDLYSLGSYGTYKVKQHLTVADWIFEISKAKYVITNSFHATVFAIIFHKQFVVVNLPSGGTTRLESLLSILNIQNRFFNSIESVNFAILDSSIDYTNVDSLLQKELAASKKFVRDALS